VKKALGIILALVMVLTMAMPVMASTNVTTGVVISGSNGDEPLIKAKWETPDSKPADNDPPTQIAPPVSYQGSSPVQFWVIVADNPITSVSVVEVEVYHPDGPPEYGSYKFQVILNDYLDALSDGVILEPEASAAIAAFEAAYAAGLVKLHDGITADDVTGELEEGEAWLWVGEYVMDYHQPAGNYKVDAFAIDAGPVSPDSHLINYFEYVAVTACEFDFEAVEYGSITSEGFVSGNNVFDGTTNPLGDGAPTMRNIGNTWCQVQVRQDDMGFGMAQPGDNWKVLWDAKLGSLVEYPPEGSSQPTLYDPAFYKGQTPSGPWTTLPGIVHLCNTWKMDFSIHIESAPTQPSYSGLMQLQCITAPFTGPNLNHPGQ
jgi:hypothetical protein